MKTNTVLIGGGMLLAAWYVYKKYMLATNLNIVPMGIGIGNNGVNISLAAQNPTSDTVTLNSFVGNLFVNGNSIATVTSFVPVVIQPNSQTPLNFSVNPNWIGLGSQALSIIQNGFDGVQAKLVGTANANSLSIPVNISF